VLIKLTSEHPTGDAETQRAVSAASGSRRSGLDREIGCGGSGTVVAKKNVNLADSVRSNGQEPVSWRGNATGSGAFNTQRAQVISAAYYFDLAARDYILADGAIELVIEGVPCSAFIEPSQSCELIFCGQLNWQ